MASFNPNVWTNMFPGTEPNALDYMRMVDEEHQAKMNSIMQAKQVQGLPKPALSVRGAGQPPPRGFGVGQAKMPSAPAGAFQGQGASAASRMFGEQALRGAPGVMSKVGNAVKGTLPILAFGAASDQAIKLGDRWGNQIGDYLYDKIVPQESFRGPRPPEAPNTSGMNPSVPFEQPVAGAKGNFSPEELQSYTPEELAMLSGGQQPASVSFSIPEQPALEAAQPEQPAYFDENSPEMNTPAREDPNDLFARQMEMLSQMPEHTIEREKVNPADEQTLKSASTNRTARPAKKGGFIEGVKRFVTAGSGPVDFSRYDRQQEDLYQAQNQLTQPEKLGAEMAAGNKRGVEGFNRDATMAEYRTGKMHPTMQYMLDLIKGDRTNMQQAERESTSRRENFENTRALNRESYKTASQSPEMLQLKAAYDFFEKFPDGNPQTFEQLYGYSLDPVFLQSVRDGRKKDDSMAKLAEVMKRLPEIRQAIQGNNAGKNAKQALQLDTSKIPTPK